MASSFSILHGSLSIIGASTLLYAVSCIWRFLSLHLTKPSHLLESYKRAGTEPTYALITGSSAGIGFGVARALAKEGFSIILLGHIRDELAEASLSLQGLNPEAAVRIIVMDARTATPEEMSVAVQSISKLQISILVNNVGGNPVKLPAFRPLGTHSMNDIDAVINMNARFMARLTALMLPILSRKSQPHERSLILNMSSMGKAGVPWIVMYGATKAFNWALSVGLARELQELPETKHINCLAIVPAEVRTQGNNQDVSESDPSWDDYGQCIVDKVDNALSRGLRELSPFMMHDIKRRILDVLPEGVRTTGVNYALGKKRDAFNAVYEKSR